MNDKTADLAGPGIGNYNELERILPTEYESLLDKKQTQRAIFDAKQYIEENKNNSEYYNSINWRNK